MKSTIRTLAATVPLLMLAAPLQGQTTLLRMTPAEGLVSQYVLGTETYMSNPMMPPSDGPTATAQAYQTETVVGVAADAIEILTSIDSTTTTGMPGASGPDLSGMSYTVGMDGRGRTTGLVDAGTLTPAAEEYVAGTLGLTFFELPEAEVGPGDTWSSQSSVETPGAMGSSMTMEWDLTYTLTGLEGDRAEISLEGTVSMSGSGGGMPMGGSGTLTGTAVFDAGMGRLTSHETAVDLEINAGGMAISMEQKSTRTLVP